MRLEVFLRRISGILPAESNQPKPPVIPHDDINTYLHNRALGVELTFSDAVARDVPVLGVPADTAVLSNIRLYGPGHRTHQPFKSELPFGLRFGDSKAALVAKFGPPDLGHVLPNKTPLLRWDTARYAIFMLLDEAGRLMQLELQLPVVKTDRPGFEAR
jgi:hypothetical protein